MQKNVSTLPWIVHSWAELRTCSVKILKTKQNYYQIPDVWPGWFGCNSLSNLEGKFRKIANEK